MIRHFTFPEQPTVLVYPSKTAKNGRFDAKVSSLFTLLEYRLDDSKEASFEVFVFVESVREVFDRIYGFNIYKTLESIHDPETFASKRKEALVEALKAAEESEKSEENVDSEKKKEINFAEMDETDLLSRFRTLVNNVDLFSSFAYYDKNSTGYLQDRDLEDILLSIGVRLSRGDIARILKRALKSDRFNYRQYVDRYVNKSNEVKFTPEFREDAPKTEQLLDIHAKSSDNEGGNEESSTVTPDITANGMVVYKGAAVNIKQTLDQHQEVKAEVTRLFSQVQEQEHVLKNYKEQVETLEKKKKRLETDVQHYKKKAYEAEKCLKTNEDDVVSYKTALQDCKRYGERLITVVERIMPSKEKTKEPSTKPETPSKKEEANGEVKSVEKSEELNADSKTEDISEATIESEDLSDNKEKIEEQNESMEVTEAQA